MSISLRDYVNQYEFDCVLPGSGETIKFKPLTTGQIKQLLTYDGEEKPSVIESALDELISTSVTTPGFNIDNLYLQDRFFLLLEIRKRTKGASYEFTYTCPRCDTDNFVSVDLNELEVSTAKEVEGEVEVNDQLRAVFSMPTRGQQKRAMLDVEKKYKKSQNHMKMAFDTVIHLYTHALTKFVTPVGEITDAPFDDKLFVVENSVDGFFSKIKEWQEKNNFGVDFTFSHECQCGFVREDTIPFTSFFS